MEQSYNIISMLSRLYLIIIVRFLYHLVKLVSQMASCTYEEKLCKIPLKKEETFFANENKVKFDRKYLCDIFLINKISQQNGGLNSDA